jgi:hypothetical protein
VTWFLASNLIGPQGLVGWGDYGTTDEATIFRLEDDSLVSSWNGNNLTIAASLLSDIWYCAITSYDSGTNTRSIYLNGELLGYDNPLGYHNPPTAANTTVGYSGPGTKNFEGLIQNAAVYNCAFTTEDASNYYLSTLPLINQGSYHLLTELSQPILAQNEDFIDIQY